MSQPRTQRGGVSGCAALLLTPLRCVRGSDAYLPAEPVRVDWIAMLGTIKG